jgi:hypothetical protein
MTTYLDVLADEIRREVPVDALPDDNTDDLFRSYAVLLLAKGEEVSRQDVHNAWVAWMSARGEEHESMRPFEQLPDDTKAEDSPFVLAIRRVAVRRSSG